MCNYVSSTTYNLIRGVESCPETSCVLITPGIMDCVQLNSGVRSQPVSRTCIRLVGSQEFPSGLHPSNLRTRDTCSESGPSTWAKKYPTAAGSRQSPVDIETSLATSDTSLTSKPLSWNYVPENTRAIVNTGHGWRVDIDSEGSELVGGPLEDTYRLQQFHCHWGFSSDKGSEHTVDGQSYAGELHLVHWNSTKYANCGEAAGYPDGLAVLGVLLKVGAKNPELQKIVDLIPRIYHRGEKAVVKEVIDPAKLLPKTFSYWTYLGSLTTPPCSESVTWILFKEPIEVSEEQLSAFRSLRCYKREEACPCDEVEGLITNNYRPPLPLGNRELRECGCA